MSNKIKSKDPLAHLPKRTGPTDEQQAIIDSLLWVKHSTCGHEFWTCLSVAEYHRDDAPELPCPVCEPTFDYRQDHSANRMLLSFGNEEANPLLACGSCHATLCPNELN